MSLIDQWKDFCAKLDSAQRLCQEKECEVFDVREIESLISDCELRVQNGIQRLGGEILGE